MEPTQVSSNRGTDTENMVRTHDEILASVKKTDTVLFVGEWVHQKHNGRLLSCVVPESYLDT